MVDADEVVVADTEDDDDDAEVELELRAVEACVVASDDCDSDSTVELLEDVVPAVETAAADDDDDDDDNGKDEALADRAELGAGLAEAEALETGDTTRHKC